MFFEETRIRTVREMILSEDEQSRRAALSKLLPMQRADFVELFEIMKGLPVTIRLLDPPLHEFLPHTQAEIEEVARAMNTDPRRLADRARDLAEFNPMLGFRGHCLSGNRRDAGACDLRSGGRSRKAHRQGRRP
jgi:pyruvate,orthophosphate dikinase